MTRLTAFSLPGISDDASTTVSPGPILIWWSLLAMRDSAAIGSPCEPVQISTTWSSGSSVSCSDGDEDAAGDREVAEVARDAHVAHHRAAEERDLAVVAVRDVDDLLDAVDVARRTTPPRCGPWRC